MTPSASTRPYKHDRFPGEMISHAVWLYFRFCVSHPDVVELLFARGITVSYGGYPQVVPEFWPTICQSAEAPAASTGRQVTLASVPDATDKNVLGSPQAC
jgi:transposase-like protein